MTAGRMRKEDGPFRKFDLETLRLPFSVSDPDILYRLEPLRSAAVDYAEVIEQMTEWRNTWVESFFTQFQATPGRTDKWFREKIEPSPHHLFFVLRSPAGSAIGHLCVRYDPARKAFELENILRGRTEVRGVMTHAMRAVCGWLSSEFPGETIFLRVFADNSSAVRLYERCGFTEVKRWPVFWLESGGEGSWSETHPRCDKMREVALMEKMQRELPR